jgi:hypothetical protein
MSATQTSELAVTEFRYSRFQAIKDSFVIIRLSSGDPPDAALYLS